MTPMISGWLERRTQAIHDKVTQKLTAWDKLDKDLIIKSFKVCGQTVNPDGSEDDRILCFREGQPCAAGREALAQLRQQDEENRRTAEEEEDEEELLNNELVVLDDEDNDTSSSGEEEFLGFESDEL